MSFAGRENAMYINTGSFASPTWLYVDRISDVKRAASRPASSRKYRGLLSTKHVRGYKTYDFNCKYEAKRAGQTHTVFDQFNNSFESETNLDILMINAKLTYPTGHALIGMNAVGFRGYFGVFKFDRDETDEDGTTYDLELKEVYEEVSGAVKEVIAFSQAIVAAA
jgi:hypothetical protein